MSTAVEGVDRCDDLAASHQFVIELVNGLVEEVIIPEVRQSGGLPLTDRHDDLEWLREIVVEELEMLKKSEVAAIKVGTIIRRPSEVFGGNSALSMPLWARMAFSANIDDCCAADRLLVGLQMTAEIWIKMFLQDNFRFQKEYWRAERFSRAANRLLSLRKRILAEANGRLKKNSLPPAPPEPEEATKATNN